MKIAIVTPAAPGSRHGNRNTATRWARLLRELGHRTEISVSWHGGCADLLIALHARRSHESLRRFAEACPQRPRILVLTGTDLYRDIRTVDIAQQSLQLATRLVVLQEMGLNELPIRLHSKTRVIYQSAPAVVPPRALTRCYEIVVSGHLRAEKDPFRCAAALRYLPAQSRIAVTHIGGAMEAAFAREAQDWCIREARYRWLGEVSYGRALRILARSRLMVLSSRIEGGANVASEALANGVPIIASHISGNIGMLGKDYAGYYPLENEHALARLLWRTESDPDYYRLLKSQCRARRHLVTAAHERASLRRLLAELS